ncbi:hypothetical protein C8Q79DRAFT_899661 [Trametes meyenii]|nr:hypothetical protein C8Q79DRAFT_899661 [Trametes meyenii]
MLPVHSTSRSPKLPDNQISYTPRNRRLSLVAAAAFSLSTYLALRTCGLAFSGTATGTQEVHGQPPTYSEYHKAELQLPQHRWPGTHPERFFFVAGHSRALGWGNALQEHLLNAYLAYEAGRTFVFANYTWNDDGSLFSKYNGKSIPSQIPYSALIRGPTVGGNFPSGDPAPLAVNKEYFDHLCPAKLELLRNDVHRDLTSSTSAIEMIEKWTAILKTIDDPCVQSCQASGPIFTHEQVFGIRTSLRELWPYLARSPIITQFGWSPLVELAFDTNREFLTPHASPQELYLTGAPFTSNAGRYTPIPGLMAIHVRRGDYEQHCTYLANWSEDFVSVNTLSGLPDTFTVPSYTVRGQTTWANREMYRQRCFPSVMEITRKVAEVRDTPEGSGIRQLYIMTNGKQAFIDELKDALWKMGEWDVVASSRDMVLNREQRYVAQAVDMLIAQRAQVFVGNGFSTLTSGVVMMRLANGFPTGSTRFW